MSTKHDDTCLQKAGDDEPIFVLRAQDALAPLVVEFWAREAEKFRCSPDKVAEAMDLAGRMRVWARENGRKLPD